MSYVQSLGRYSGFKNKNDEKMGFLVVFGNFYMTDLVFQSRKYFYRKARPISHKIAFDIISIGCKGLVLTDIGRPIFPGFEFPGKREKYFLNPGNSRDPGKFLQQS